MNIYAGDFSHRCWCRSDGCDFDLFVFVDTLKSYDCKRFRLADCVLASIKIVLLAGCLHILKGTQLGFPAI